MTKIKSFLITCICLCLFVMGGLLFVACNKDETPEPEKYTIKFIVDGEVYSTFETYGNEIIPLPEIDVGDWGVFSGWKHSTGHEFENEDYKNCELTEDLEIHADIKYYFTRSGNSITGLTYYGKTLSVITIPKETTSIVNGFCDSNVENIDFSKATNLQSIEDSFQNTSNLKSLNLSACTELKTLNGAFANSSLESLILPSGIIHIYNGILNGNETLNSLDLSHCSNLTTLGYYAFSGSNLESLSLPSSLTSIGSSILDGNERLKSLDLSHCSELKNLGEDAFANSNLSSIILPSSLTNISNTAFKNTNLDEIVIENSIYTSKDKNNNNNCLINKTTNTLIKATKNTEISEYIENIDIEAFSYNSNIKSVTIPSNIKVIKSGMFRDCSLESIKFSSKLQTIEIRSFVNCENLTTIDFSLCGNLVQIPYLAFKGCDKLTSVDLSNCVNLSILSRESFDISTNIIIDNLAYTSKDKNGNNNCLIEKSGNVLIKANENTVIPDYIESIANGAFAGCENLTTIDFSLCSNLERIGDIAFEGCDKLTSVDLSNCVNLKYIDWGAFADCVNLESINLRGCAMLYSIDGRAFKNCVKLTSIDLSDCVELTSIYEVVGDRVFDGCVNLKTVMIGSEKIAKNIKDRTSFGRLFENAETIYIKTGLTVIGSKYLHSNFTKLLVSDKEGFDKYVKNV